MKPNSIDFLYYCTIMLGDGTQKRKDKRASQGRIQGVKLSDTKMLLVAKIRPQSFCFNI